MFKMIAGAAALVLAAQTASAASMTISDFSTAGYNSDLSGFTRVVSQDFENASVGMVGGGLSTNVGNFSVYGKGVGSGGTVTRAGFFNDGTELAIREGNVYGRVGTTQALTGNRAMDQYLDSNDTFGIQFDAFLANGKTFNKIMFTVSDAAEFGTQLAINTSHGAAQILSRAVNGAKYSVLVDFGGFVDSASISLVHLKNGKPVINDGFSIDDVAISAVPLPASAFLLLAGLGGLGAVRRARKTA